jgi:uncharacterized protein involved in outer membrane biogenesis
MGALLKSKLVIAVAIVAALIGLYALLGFKVAPGIVRNKAIDYVRAEYGRELSLGEIRIHPFKLQFEVHDLAFPDADGVRMVGFERLFVDFELSSLWKRALYFRQVDVDLPYVRAVIRPDGSMNFADLTPRTPPAEGEDDEPPRVWIADLDVDGGVVDFLDRARRQPFERTFDPVTFHLQEFKTTPEGGDFLLHARSESDEQFDWKGHFALAPVVSSEGEFTIARLRAAGVGEFLGEVLSYQLTSGSIDLGGRYRLALGSTTEMELTLPSIELSTLALRARGVEEDWIRVPTVAISDTVVAMPANSATIGRVAVSGLSAKVWLDKDGAINLVRLFAPTAAVQSVPGQSPPVQSVAAESKERPASDWTVTIATVELTDAGIDLEDRSLTPAPKFVLAPVAVKLTDLTLDQRRPVPLMMSATLDGETSLKAAGTIVPDPFAAALDVELDGLDLRKLQPYVAAAADMTLRRGQAQATGKLTLSPPEDKDPDLAFAGDVRVTGFRTIDNLLKEDFINFERLDLRKLRFAMQPDSLTIDRAVLRKPYARVSISPDQVLNVAAVFDPEGTAAALAERKAKAAAEASADSAPKKRQPRRERKKQQAAPAAPPRAKSWWRPAGRSAFARCGSSPVR